MSRSIVISGLILVTAAGLGAILHISLGLSVVEASLAGIAAFFVMAFLHVMTGQGGAQQGDVYDQVALNETRTALQELRREVGSLHESVEGMRQHVQDRSGMEARMSAELRIVETLIKQLAEVVARIEVQAAMPRREAQAGLEHHTQHADETGNPNSSVHGHGEAAEDAAVNRDFSADDLPRDPARRAAEIAGRAAALAGGDAGKAQAGLRHDGRMQPSEEDVIVPRRPGTGRFAHLSDTQMLRLVRSSVQANRVDLYLQPIVTLPQRKVRYYEALTRLRAEDGEVILPADYMPVAEPAGVMPLIDNILLFRCVQVVKRLSTRNREAGVFCNIAFHSLVDSEFFADFTGYLKQNQDLAGSIIFEIGQATLESMGPEEEGSLAMLAEMGFRFSLDKVRTLSLSPERLAERGFRFVKVPADLLMQPEGDMDIHPMDLSPLLARRNIELIVERVESEAMIVDLLDYNIGLGQGYLFSAPRPVRAEVLGEHREGRQV